MKSVRIITGVVGGSARAGLHINTGVGIVGIMGVVGIVGGCMVGTVVDIKSGGAALPLIP